MRFSGTLVAVAALLFGLPAVGETTLDRPLDPPMPYHVDSGLLPNPSTSSAVLHEAVVQIDGAGWLRVYFGDVRLGQGSFLRIRSDLDGEVQELDAAALASWSNSTAYFNGDTVHVELVGGPNSQDNRLEIEQVAWEASGLPEGTCGICGADDRVPSFEDFAARLLPNGCSATIYNTDSCAVSAGHCVSGGMVLQFQVPPSTGGCQIVHPPVSEQFPVSNFSFTNGGPGQDWSVLVMGTNNLDEKPFERYGLFRPIATTGPSVGDPLAIWGYGVDDECPRSQVQQTSTGSLTSVGPTHFRHNTDATFGNSGSAIQRDGEILGIVTHCPCPNWATRVDHPSFAAAREALCPSLVPETATLLSVEVPDGWGTPVSGGIPELEESDDAYFVVDSLLGGPRNNALTVVTAQSPFTSVSELDVRVEFGPVDAAPVYAIVQLFNWDTGKYKGLFLAIASTGSSTIVNLEDVTNPDAYVDPTGKVQLRLVFTARASQTPGGFTKRIDQVLVTVLD